MWMKLLSALPKGAVRIRISVIRMQDQTQRNSLVDEQVTGRPWWKTCFIVAVIVVLTFLLVSFLFIRFVGGSGPRYTNRLPDHFPTNFVLYRMGLVKQIMYYPASEKDKPIRLLMTPVRFVVGATPQGASVVESVERFMGAVRKDETVTMTWSNVDAKAEEVLAFYAQSMRTAGIADPQMRQTPEKDISQMTGISDKGLKINVLLVDDQSTPNIEGITVVVEYPTEKK